MKRKRAEPTILANGLYIIATPIGNLDDIGKRSIKVFDELDLIICENPKQSIKLLNKLGIKKKLIALHDYNEQSVINKISEFQYFSKIGLISDAGSPLISDPGYNLVKDYINKKIMVTVIPGPSSVVSSIQLSGMPINSFAFYGFAPKQFQKRKRFLEEINDIGLTSVFFVSGKNLKILINDIVEIIGDRAISICKELTKLNEAIYRESASKIQKMLIDEKINVKGEFTIVLSSKAKKTQKIINKKVEIEIINLLKKYSLTETVRIVHNLTEISKKDVYKTAIKIKDN